MKKILITTILLAAMLLTAGFGSLRSVAMADDAQEAGTAEALTPEQEAEAKKAYEEGFSYYFSLNGKSFDKQKAVAAFQKAAALGLGDAYFWLGMIEEFGVDPARWDRTMKYFQAAVEHGSAYGLYGQGILYEDGLGVVQDYVRAQDLFQQAIDADCPAGWIGLGNLYRYGEGLEQDGSNAAICFEQLLESDDWYARNAACTNLARLYLDGAVGLEKDLEKALTYYLRAADAGFPSAYRGLGNLYYYGEAAEQDEEKAFAYFSKEADCGWSYDLGFLYWEGFGTEQDYARAAELFEKDVESGLNAEYSLFMLAHMKANGMGMEKDAETAAEYARKALAASPNDERLAEYVGELLDDLGVELPEKSSFSGTWRLTMVSTEDEQYTPDEAKVKGQLMLYEDGTGLFVLNGSESAFPKWEETDDGVLITGPNGVTLDCTVGDEGLAVPYMDDYTLIFGIAEGRGDSSLLYPVYRGIDTAKGAHLRYVYHTDYLNADSAFDVHARGGSYYSQRTTTSGSLTGTGATCLLDGKAYTLYPDKKTGSLTTETSLSVLLENALMMDTLYQKICQRAHDYDYALEIREVDGVAYLVEVFPTTVTSSRCAFYFDADGRLAYVLEDAPATNPELGESFYTIESIDDKLDDSLFDLSGYTLE